VGAESVRHGRWGDKVLLPQDSPWAAMKYNTRIGLFGIGLDAYWPQFPALKKRLEGYLGVVDNRLKRPGVALIHLGLIDTPAKALEAGHLFRREDVDLICLYVKSH
jgi:L-arabinose isomerase